MFTTTEVITSHLIQSNYKDVYEPKLMPDQKMLAGNIHMLKTELVRKKMDGILPPIVEGLRRKDMTLNTSLMVKVTNII